MSQEETVNITDRVRRNVSTYSNIKVDKDIESIINKFQYKNEEELHQRIIELEQEWSVERRIETFASTLIISGSLLSLFTNKKWAWLPAVVGTFLLQHGIQGWCPPLPLLRALGARTRKEIDWEKFSLKIIRGDFEHVSDKSPEELLEIVKAL